MQILELRQKLVAKEQVIVEAMKQEHDDPRLLALQDAIRKQREEIEALQMEADADELRCQHMRKAIDFIKTNRFVPGDGSPADLSFPGPRPEEPVIRVIEEIRKVVRSTKITEMIAERDREMDTSDEFKIPDRAEIEVVEKEVARM